jgi:hypothetical protein
MSRLTNNQGFGLAMAVWLAHDEYQNGQDEFPGENVISATGLLKPLRQIILTPRVPANEAIPDLSDFVASRFGHAIHDSVEHAWKTGYVEAMRKLGYPQKMINRVKINPETVEDGDMPVYLEQRYFRRIEVNGVKIVISGKFDQIINGEVNDIKTTSAYSFVSGSKDEDYRLQGSIYRWINPNKIHSDYIRIQHVFTDWQRMQAKINPAYPQNRILEKRVELMPLDQTEQWIRAKIIEIIRNQDLEEPELPFCTDKELWKTDPVFKFYSDPAKAAEGGRATKNFDTRAEAMNHLASKGGKGAVLEVPGKVRACSYCPVFSICSQKDRYSHD